MLDDLKYIHHSDPQDALGIAEKQPAQLEYTFETRGPGVSDNKSQISNIVFSGMGGSALPALLSRSWPGYKLPFEVCRGYDIPKYVSDKTLFIAASYSGNTEETLSAIEQARKKKAKLVLMAGGGEVEQIAKSMEYPFIKVPKAEQPRYAVFYMLAAIVKIIETAGLTAEKDMPGQLKQACGFLQEAVKEWLPTVSTDWNAAKQMAMEIAGKSPVIYAGPLLAPAAYKWKISFNENAKNVAWWNEYPEFNHNEFIGWSSHPVQKPYFVIDLRSNFEHPRIQKRFELSDKLLSGQRPHAHVVEAQGENLLEQLLWTVVFGDFVTLYLALLNGVNPAPVELVEKFKKELG